MSKSQHPALAGTVTTNIQGIDTAANYKGGPLPWSEWRVVNKELADQWLEKNTANRKFRRMHAEKMGRDVENGDREITHQGIGFDVKGVLIDGQHTLKTISQTGRPLYLLVTYNLPERAKVVVDSGASRTAYDALTLSGRDGTKSDMAVARLLRSNRRSSTMEALHAFDKYKERIDLVMSWFPNDNRKYVTISPVIATLVRATYTQDHDKLRRFAEILVTSSPDSDKPGEMAVLKLRDFLIRGKNGGTEKYYDEVRERTRYTLKFFLENRHMAHLRREEVEIFPLPEEEETKE